MAVTVLQSGSTMPRYARADLRHVAVIGAGIAGLTMARELRACGISVTVFEKSPRPGGRMATREAGDYCFDHGVQYLRAKSALFAHVLADWHADGLIAEWLPGKYVGAPLMRSPAHAMASNLDIEYNTLVSAVSRTGSSWRVHGSVGEGSPSSRANPLRIYDAVLLAIPAPQAASLLAAYAHTLPGMETIRFRPSWALMIGFDEATGAPVDWTSYDDSVIASITRTSSKPLRKPCPPCFVVCASHLWSTENLEIEAEQAKDKLLQAFGRLTGFNSQPAFASAHRWRFAFVDCPLGTPFIWDDTNRLGACGDWCLGGRVEHAWLSGQALGRKVGRFFAPDVVFGAGP